MGELPYIPARAAAEILGVPVERVIAWLRAGELRGYDASVRAATKRRYRVERASITEFIDRRAIGPVPSPVRRAKRRRETSVTQYY